MLLLVATHRHDVRIEREDVGSHQDGICEQPVVDQIKVIARQSRLFILIAVTALQQAHRRHGR